MKGVETGYLRVKTGYHLIRAAEQPLCMRSNQSPSMDTNSIGIASSKDIQGKYDFYSTDGMEEGLDMFGAADGAGFSSANATHRPTTTTFLHHDHRIESNGFSTLSAANASSSSTKAAPWSAKATATYEDFGPTSTTETPPTASETLPFSSSREFQNTYFNSDTLSRKPR